MKVCHVTSLHPANDERILRKECASLATKYDVTLIAPNTIDKEDYNVHIKGVKLPSNRILRLLQMSKVYDAMMAVNADVYHFHDPELITLGTRIQKKGKIVIFDSHEDVPQQILDKEWIPKFLRTISSKIYAYFEQHQLCRYNALVTVTPLIVDRLKQFNSNTILITNYPRYQNFPDKREFEPLVCFAGGIGAQWMHENIINSLEYTQCSYLLAGKPEYDYLERIQKLPNWSKVLFFGVIPHQHVLPMLQRCSAGLALNDYKANVGFKIGSLGNTKIFEYMMAGIPVIATDFELWKEIIESYDCGICINPHDINAIAEAINYFVNNPDIARQKGENGRRAVKEKYNWATQETNLFELYQKLEGKLR